MKLVLVVLALAFLATLPASAAGPRSWLEEEIAAVTGDTRTILGRTDGLKERLQNVKQNVDRIVGQVNEGLADLTGPMRSMFRSGLEELRSVIDEEREGLDAFLGAGGGCGPGSACAAFRESLGDLIQGTEDLTNELLTSQSLADLHVEFDPFLRVIDVAPGASLYPVYRALSVETNFVEAGTTILRTARERLVLAKGCLGIGADVPVTDECSTLGDDPSQCLQTAKDLRTVANVLSLLGHVLVALGETKFSGEFQVHGYVGGSITNNRKKKFGTMILGASSALKGMGDSLEERVRYCILRRNQEAILANQALILDRLGVAGGEGPTPCGCTPPRAEECRDDRSGHRRGRGRHR